MGFSLVLREGESDRLHCYHTQRSWGEKRAGVKQGRHLSVYRLGSALGRVKTLLVFCTFVLQQAAGMVVNGLNLILRTCSLGYRRAAVHSWVSGLAFTLS